MKPKSQTIKLLLAKGRFLHKQIKKIKTQINHFLHSIKMVTVGIEPTLSNDKWILSPPP